jgi:ribulose-phosphate 3-epimerase
MVLIMTVNPGYGGQAFIPAMLPKISDLARRIREIGAKTEIQVDGGINQLNIGGIAKAGARVFVAGSAIFKSNDPGQAVQDLKQAATEALKR